MKKVNKPQNAIILASEITRGMKSIGTKCLLNIYQTIHIIDYQIQFLMQNYKNINIYIATGFEEDKIVKHTQQYKNIKYIHNPNYKYDNQLGSLLLCFKSYDFEDCLIISNGILLGTKLIFDNHNHIITINKERNLEFQIGCNQLDNNIMSYLFYNLPNKWTECAYLNKEGIKCLLKNNEKNNLNKLFLFEGLNIISNDYQVKIQNIPRSTAMKINSIKDLQQAKKYYDKYILT